MGARLASMGGGLRDFLGIGGSIQTGPGMATTWQAATAGQKLSALGRSDAAALGGGMLLYAGLRRGGLSGLGMSAAGGALIGFRYGGPIGAVIGGIAGAAAGVVRLFIKGAQEKAREKIKALYGVDMQDKGVLRQIVETARQSFGSNLDVAIRSPQIRDLIELYAMSTGQRMSGQPDRMRAVELVQSRGGIFEAPAYLSSTPLPTLSRLPAAASPPPGTTIINFTMPAEAVNEAFNGRTQQFIVQHPRAIQGAAHQAARSSYGRREAAAMLMSPGTILA